MAGLTKVLKISIHLNAKGPAVCWLDHLRVGLDALDCTEPRMIARLDVKATDDPSVILRALADEYDRRRT